MCPPTDRITYYGIDVTEGSSAYTRVYYLAQDMALAAVTDKPGYNHLLEYAWAKSRYEDDYFDLGNWVVTLKQDLRMLCINPDDPIRAAGDEREAMTMTAFKQLVNSAVFGPLPKYVDPR